MSASVNALWFGDEVTHGGILISSAGASQDSLYEPVKAASAGPPRYAEESPHSGQKERKKHISRQDEQTSEESTERDH